jgi:arylsulfatase A-like enzyme
MRRRDFIKTAGTITAGMAVGKNRAEAKSGSKPNIIYILLDDAGYGDLGCYGQRKYETPNIDSLAEDGIKFTDHYSGSPVCAPSRCCLLTGYHTGHAEIRGNGEVVPEGQKPLAEDVPTIATLLKDAGYVTGAFGKWGLGFPGSSGEPLNKGFDRFFGYNCQRKAHNYYPKYLYSDRERVQLDGRTYSHDLIMDNAFEFIRDNKDKPFFAYFPVTIPHASLHAPEDVVRPFRKKFKLHELEFGFYSGKPVRNPKACFAGMMTHLDKQVGGLMILLKELGIDDNTLVMLSSDNGPHQEGGHKPDFFGSKGPFRGYKRDLYEGGIRVPMITRWPGKISPGSVTDHPSAFWDVMPTLCDIVGIDTPEEIDGISFLPTLTRQGKQEKHPYLYWEFNPKGGSQAVRMGEWKAVRNKVTKNPDAPLELYNLNKDPVEMNNQADERPEIISKVKEILKNARTENVNFPLF